MKKQVHIAVCLLLGAILGPVVLAVVESALACSNRQDTDVANDVRRLAIVDMLRAYREETKKRDQGKPIFSDDFRKRSNGAECGYEPDRVFPHPSDQLIQSRQQRRYNGYAGYIWLRKWRDEIGQDAIDTAIGDQLNARVSLFEAGFLQRCVTSIPFSGFCLKRIKELQDGAYENLQLAEVESHFDLRFFGHADEVVCSYVDGVAAQRGLPQASRDRTKP